jgi:hypothetical protein
MAEDDETACARRAGEWYDVATGGRGSPDGRRRAIAIELHWLRQRRAKGIRPEPGPRPLGQASLDAQPAKRAARLYVQQIATAKARAAAPLGPRSSPREAAADPNAPDLFG